MVRVLFICLGNICRSPTAEGVFLHRVQQLPPHIAANIHVDSAGTGSWHLGCEPDTRAQIAARRRGYDLSQFRARQVSREDFQRFNYILAMDRHNYADLQTLAPADFRGRLAMLLDFLPAGRSVRDVPDPYHGGEQGFDLVLDLVEAAVDGLLAHILKHHFDTL